MGPSSALQAQAVSLRSASLYTHPLPLLRLSTLGCVGRPEEGEGIRNVEQFGGEEVASAKWCADS